jgi:hypothetical protein
MSTQLLLNGRDQQGLRRPTAHAAPRHHQHCAEEEEKEEKSEYTTSSADPQRSARHAPARALAAVMTPAKVQQNAALSY